MKEAVVALGFGVPAGLNSNKYVGWSATKKAAETGAIVFTQLGPAMYVQKVRVVPMPNETVDNYPTTMQVATAAVAWAMANDIGRMHVAAARPHLRRAVMEFQLAARLAGANIHVFGCPYATQVPYAEWFDAQSEQWWTRSRVHWWIREVPLRTIFKYLPERWYLKLTNKPF